MTSSTVSTRLEPDETALLESLSERSGMDRSSMIRTLLRRGMKELRLEQAVAAYRNETASLSRAAEMAGLPQWDFIALMEKEQLDLHYGLEEFEHDIHTLSSLS